MLECVIGLIISLIVIGFVIQCSVSVVKDCAYIRSGMVACSGLSSVGDIFARDFCKQGSVQLFSTGSQGIIWRGLDETVAWVVSPDGLRRLAGTFDEENGSWKKVKKTVVSRSVTGLQLTQEKDGYLLEVQDAHGNHHKRYIENRV